jgi:hypothetical protein
VVAALLRGLAGADEEVGADAVGDEGLRAVDDVTPVDLARRGPERGDVGAGAGFRDAERSDLLALDSGNEPALLLLLRAELPDRRSGDLGMCPDPGRDPAAAPGPGELFEPDRVVYVVAALPAVLDLVLEAEEAKLAAPGIELAWELARLLPLVNVRRDLLADEAADRLAQLLVLRREGRQDGALAGVPYDGDGGLQSSSIV